VIYILVLLYSVCDNNYKNKEYIKSWAIKLDIYQLLIEAFNEAGIQ
jgi:hypothetical protein